jgi:hypothetical protein
MDTKKPTETGSCCNDDAMTRDQWCTEFMNYLVVGTDRELPRRLAIKIAATEWPTQSAVDRKVAAKAWFARRAASPSAPRDKEAAGT